MQVRIKKEHPDSKIPSYAKPGDAGMDLTAVGVTYSDDKVTYETGLAFEIPEGYVGLVFPRSSNCKKDLLLTNSVAVIDSGYRGTVKMVYRHAKDAAPAEYVVGDRVGQILILPYPQIEFVEAQALSESVRGTGGFGHTGT